MVPVLQCQWNDRETGAKAYFVIDTLKSELCAGGIRMRKGATADEAQRLARTMTYKLAAIGIPFGGAKAAIDYDPTLPDSYGVLERFLAVHRPWIREFWVTNEDLGTKEEDIVAILKKIGIPSPFQAGISKSQDPERTAANLRQAVELQVDGLRMVDTVTGYGVAQATLEALLFMGRRPAECSVVIQGFGSVGGSTARYLWREGCRIAGIADAEGVIACPDGLDIDGLLSRRNRWGVISRSGLPREYQCLPREEWVHLNADILIPAAVADAIHAENCDGIRAKLIVEGANIPTTLEAEKRLSARGVVIVPDFVANAGAIGYTPSIILGRIQPRVDDALGFLKTQIRSTTRKVLEKSRTEGLTPREAAIQLVKSAG
ncbi:MAG: glutamate dehydrogenase [Chloroflexi bacterium]|nr:glutamate dehydrogenase [Chloroflexota bacterium]